MSNLTARGCGCVGLCVYVRINFRLNLNKTLHCSKSSFSAINLQIDLISICHRGDMLFVCHPKSLDESNLILHSAHFEIISRKSSRMDYSLVRNESERTPDSKLIYTILQLSRT